MAPSVLSEVRSVLVASVNCCGDRPRNNFDGGGRWCTKHAKEVLSGNRDCKQFGLDFVVAPVCVCMHGQSSDGTVCSNCYNPRMSVLGWSNPTCGALSDLLDPP